MGLPIDEIVQRRAYNAAADLIDGNVARGLGGKVAFTDPERTLTYGELQARAASSRARSRRWASARKAASRCCCSIPSIFRSLFSARSAAESWLYR